MDYRRRQGRYILEDIVDSRYKDISISARKKQKNSTKPKRDYQLERYFKTDPIDKEMGW
jgi:hypothetical protein